MMFESSEERKKSNDVKSGLRNETVHGNRKALLNM